MEAEPPRWIVILRSELRENRYLDKLKRLHDRHRQVGDELNERRSIAADPVLQTGVGIMVVIV